MVMRQQVWIDRHVQGVLVGRVLLYWSGILIYFGLSIGCYHWWQNPEWTLTEHLGAMVEQVLPCLPTLVLLLPLVIFDIVRLSNRFAGPIFRLRHHLTELSQNSQISPLNFRDEDYWQQLAEPINLLQQKMWSSSNKFRRFPLFTRALVKEHCLLTMSVAARILPKWPRPYPMMKSLMSQRMQNHRSRLSHRSRRGQ